MEPAEEAESGNEVMSALRMKDKEVLKQAGLEKVERSQ